MINPILKNRQFLMLYIIFFLLSGVTQFINLYFYIGFPLNQSLADASLFTGIMSLLGLIIWYIIRWNPMANKDVLSLLTTHIFSASIIIVVWIVSGYSILTHYFENYKLFDEFFLTNGWRIFQGLFIYSFLTLIYYGLISNENLQQKIREEIKLKELIKEAELSALKSQINPHFLFNSLNSISSLTIKDPEKAQEMIIQLSEFLRHSISFKEKELVSLEDELDNIDRYLSIEKIRFGSKIHSTNTIENACYKIKIPSMILQPLYENAVKYGVSERTELTNIHTQCYMEKYYMHIVISNECSDQAPGKRGSGMGLKNIDERLKLIYKQYPLMTYKKTNSQFIVKLNIPIEQGLKKS